MLSDNDLDDMIQDLQSEDFVKEPDMQQAYLDKLDEILSVIESDSFKQKLTDSNKTVNENEKISNLTVGQLKSVIKEFTDEIINAINNKHVAYPTLPQTPQPNWYGPVTPLEPWEPNKVWCSDRTVMDEEIMELHKKLNGEING